MEMIIGLFFIIALINFIFFTIFFVSKVFLTVYKWDNSMFTKKEEVLLIV